MIKGLWLQRVIASLGTCLLQLISKHLCLIVGRAWVGFLRHFLRFGDFRDRTCTPAMFVIISSPNRCTGGLKPNDVCFFFSPLQWQWNSSLIWFNMDLFLVWIPFRKTVSKLSCSDKRSNIFAHLSLPAADKGRQTVSLPCCPDVTHRTLG